MKKPLTPRQARFVEEYLVDLNATQAAIRAGYSPKTAGQQGERLLRNVEISQAITEAQAARSRRAEINQDYVVANLTEIVERCMQRAPVMVREGRAMVQATDEDDRHVWQFQAKPAVSALQLLGKHLGMFVDRVETRDLTLEALLDQVEPEYHGD